MRNLRILRLRFANCCIYTILLCGCKTWTLKVITLRWVLRNRGLTIYAMRTRLEELKKKERITNMKKRKILHLGHMIGRSKLMLLKLVLEGKIEAKRGFGMRKHSWLNNPIERSDEIHTPYIKLLWQIMLHRDSCQASLQLHFTSLKYKETKVSNQCCHSLRIKTDLKLLVKSLFYYLFLKLNDIEVYFWI